MRERRVSVIIPALNEAGIIENTLRALQTCRARAHEVIVVDGGSTDGTAELARPLADKVLHAARGRALQMNEGARQARGDILLFLHADTLLPDDADWLICWAMSCHPERGWGRFDIRLSGRHPLLRLVEHGITLRSAVTGIATGDQAIFVTRELFEAVGGFDPIPLMEDVALSRKLLVHARPCRLRAPVRSSSRRWEEHGILRTVVLMWRLRLAYFFGADPAELTKTYYAELTKTYYNPAGNS